MTTSTENTVERPESFDDLYPGRFLKASHLRGKRFTLTIADVWVEGLEGESGIEKKAILSFQETELQYVLPKINGVCLKEMWGGNVKAWIGKRVTLYPTDQLMPLKRGQECVRVFGSPDIERPVTVEFRPPKRRKITMHLKPTGGA